MTSQERKDPALVERLGWLIHAGLLLLVLASLFVLGWLPV